MTFDEKPSGDKYHPVNWSQLVGVPATTARTRAALKACSSGALSKDERGVVKLDTDKCNGCTFCQAACPFDVPRFRPMDGRIDKCTLCIDRLDNGGIPACVKTCQPEALRFGPREEMLKKAHEACGVPQEEGLHEGGGLW